MAVVPVSQFFEAIVLAIVTAICPCYESARIRKFALTAPHRGL
jgi:hypothetical protein